MIKDVQLFWAVMAGFAMMERDHGKHMQAKHVLKIPDNSWDWRIAEPIIEHIYAEYTEDQPTAVSFKTREDYIHLTRWGVGYGDCSFNTPLEDWFYLVWGYGENTDTLVWWLPDPHKPEHVITQRWREQQEKRDALSRWLWRNDEL